MLPHLSEVSRDDTHRLIPSRYTDKDESVLTRLTGDPDDLSSLFELEGATNDRLLGEAPQDRLGLFRSDHVKSSIQLFGAGRQTVSIARPSFRIAKRGSPIFVALRFEPRSLHLSVFYNAKRIRHVGFCLKPPFDGSQIASHRSLSGGKSYETPKKISGPHDRDRHAGGSRFRPE